MTEHFPDDPRSHRERMLAGELYIGGTDPDSARIAQRAVQLADAYHRAAIADERAARPLLAELLGTLGEGAFIKPPLFVDYGENIHLGARSFVNYNLTALDVVSITIGEDCQIGPNVQLLTPTPRSSRGRAATSSRRRSRSPSATTCGSAAASSSAPASRSVRTA